MTPRKAHRTATIVLSLAIGVLGVALIVQSLAAGHGAASARLLLGVLFIAAGVGRMYVAVKRGGA
jgi:predicted membrane channel-forming protein YqfA (hemolysin III family)